jgi:hypothetical protein
MIKLSALIDEAPHGVTAGRMRSVELTTLPRGSELPGIGVYLDLVVVTAHNSPCPTSA